ncbi:MAG TPA: chalcone isomerase family protein [Burkholderiales bacterium]|nr:chalcone isomerase family protein [Burkholderiales bacterium]
MSKALIAALSFLFCGSLLANTQLPAQLLREAPDLRLLGRGEMRWFGLHLYDAALWSSADPWSPRQTYALSIEYARDIPGKRLVESSLAEMRRLGARDEDKLARWETALNGVFPDVRKGDRIVGVHLPGRSATFYHQGRMTGSIDDAEFAETFFAIWLDPRTREPSLRKALLGLR